MIRTDTILAGRYQILELIGSGGMADVYKAADLKLSRPVAVKVLKQHLSEDAAFVKRFQVEGQAAASLNNPNIISIYDVGSQNGIYYIVMELINGITLKEYIRRKGMLTARETMAITAQVAVGLRAAHAKHIVHRDIKPQNIILSREGKVKVTDFGIARAITDETKSTNNNNAMGSVHYIAPEQAKGLMCDERSDIYSLGIVMYEMITGQVPFDKESSIAVALAHMNETMVPPSDLNIDCPVALEQIIFRCTQKSRERRYHNCTELLADLKIAVSSPDFNFEKQEQENLMKSDTLVFSPEEVENVRRMSSGSAVTVVNGENDTAELPQENGNGSRRVSIDDRDKRRRNRDTGGLFHEDQREDEKNSFDRIVLLTGVIVGAVIICLIIYIVASLSGCLQNDAGKKPSGGSSQTYPSESYVQPVDEEPDTEEEEIQTVETIPEDEFDPETQTIVPNVVGMKLQLAINTLQNADLEYKISSNIMYSDEYKIGLICKQNYEEGTRVPKNTVIIIYMSQGTDKFEIKESYVGGPIAAFRNDISKFTDIINVEYEKVLDENIPANTIISIEPSSGLVTNGDTVRVRYSIGPEYVLVPNLYGYTKAEAEMLLSDYGLVLGGAAENYDDNIEAGRVCGQSREPQSRIRNGSSVDIVISLGVKMVTIPDWIGVGIALEDAQYGLNEVGLSYRVEEQYSADVEPGHLISMSHEAGSTVRHDEVIVLYISKAEETEPSTDPPEETVAIPVMAPSTMLDDCVALLSSMGFDPANIITQPAETSDWNLNNVVYEQSPEPGTRVKVSELPTYQIILKYWVYKEPSTEPPSPEQPPENPEQPSPEGP